MLENLIFVGVLLVIFLLSVGLVRIFCSYAKNKGLVSIPNSRSFHQGSIPLGGGIIFVFFWVVGWLLSFIFNLTSFKELIVFLPSTLMVSIIGYWDDHKNLTAKQRLIAQLIASILCVSIIGEIPYLHLFGRSAVYLGSFGIILTIIGLIWSTNLYNFMDGLDGMAAVEALFVFGMSGLLFWHNNAIKMAILSWLIVAMVAGFLVWNWPKAKVFMGDVGSYFLGFLVALFSLIGDIWYNIPVVFWFILYGVFWFDATVTVIRRFIFKENLTVAHREHAFHRVQRLGFSHQQVLLGIITLNMVLSSIVIWVLFIQPDYLKWGLLLAIIILTIIYIVIEKLKSMERMSLQ